jgi:hypothetical protein
MSSVQNEDKLTVSAFNKSTFRGLSIPYASPELLKEYKRPTGADYSKAHPHAADLYAFGVTCYEVIIRGSAWVEAEDADYVINKVLSGKRPLLTPRIMEAKKNDELLNGLMVIMNACWCQNVDRPKMAVIFAKLTEMANFSFNKMSEEASNTRVLY